MTNKELFNFIKNKRGSISRDNCNRIIDGSIQTLEIPSVSSIRNYAFYECFSLISVTMPESVTRIGEYAFDGCRSLTSITIPSSVTDIASNAFFNCSNLENVTLEEDFQGSGLNLSASTKFSVDTMIAMFNALADLTGQQAKTLTLGSTNLAKLTNEQIAIATEKNWTLA